MRGDVGGRAGKRVTSRRAPSETGGVYACVGDEYLVCANRPGWYVGRRSLKSRTRRCEEVMTRRIVPDSRSGRCASGISSPDHLAAPCPVWMKRCSVAQRVWDARNPGWALQLRVTCGAIWGGGMERVQCNGTERKGRCSGYALNLSIWRERPASAHAAATSAGQTKPHKACLAYRSAHCSGVSYGSVAPSRVVCSRAGDACLHPCMGRVRPSRPATRARLLGGQKAMMRWEVSKVWAWPAL